MDEKIWNLIDGQGQQFGPYSQMDLTQLFLSGQVNHESLVWREGMTDWMPAGQIQGLLPPNPVATGQLQAQPQAAVDPWATEQQNQQPVVEEVPPPPTWLGGLNVLTCIGAICLFFAPWVELRCSEMPDSASSGETVRTEDGLKKKVVKVGEEEPESMAGKPLFSQTGFQAIQAKMTPIAKKPTKPASTKTKPKGDGKNPEIIDKQIESAINDGFMHGMVENIQKAFDEDKIGGAVVTTCALVAASVALLFGLLSWMNGSNGMFTAASWISISGGAALILQRVIGVPADPRRWEMEGLSKLDGEPSDLFTLHYSAWFYITMILLLLPLIYLLINRSNKKPKSTMHNLKPPAQGGLNFH